MGRTAPRRIPLRPSDNYPLSVCFTLPRVLFCSLVALYAGRGLFVPLLTEACMATTAVQTTTGTTPSTVCCPMLNQTLTNTSFPDGILTFTYNNIACRTSVFLNCSEPNPTLTLNAAITANQLNFLNISLDSTTFTGTCDSAGNWDFDTPPLVNPTLQCILTNPSQR